MVGQHCSQGQRVGDCPKVCPRDSYLDPFGTVERKIRTWQQADLVQSHLEAA